jgi:hypothetical protein
LGNEPFAMLGPRFQDQVPKVFIDVGHPIGGKEDLILPCDGTFEANHGIDPGSELGFDSKLWVSTVLASTVGDSIINDEYFSVVSQIDTGP